MYVYFHWYKFIQYIWFMWSSPVRKEGLAQKYGGPEGSHMQIKNLATN